MKIIKHVIILSLFINIFPPVHAYGQVGYFDKEKKVSILKYYLSSEYISYRYRVIEGTRNEAVITPSILNVIIGVPAWLGINYSFFEILEDDSIKSFAVRQDHRFFLGTLMGSLLMLFVKVSPRGFKDMLITRRNDYFFENDTEMIWIALVSMMGGVYAGGIADLYTDDDLIINISGFGWFGFSLLLGRLGLKDIEFVAYVKNLKLVPQLVYRNSKPMMMLNMTYSF